MNSRIVGDLHHPEVSPANALADAVQPSDVRVGVSVESQEGLEIVVVVVVKTRISDKPVCPMRGGRRVGFLFRCRNRPLRPEFKVDRVRVTSRCSVDRYFDGFARDIVVSVSAYFVRSGCEQPPKLTLLRRQNLMVDTLHLDNSLERNRMMVYIRAQPKCLQGSKINLKPVW